MTFSCAGICSILFCQSSAPLQILIGEVPQIHFCREPAYCILSAYCIFSAALSTASSFRIWNSSTGILSLPVASVRNSAHDKGHEEGGSAYAKAGSSFRSPPGNSRAYTPKPESAYFLLVLSPKPLTLRGALPHYLSLKKVSLQFQLIIPGCDSV